MVAATVGIISSSASIVVRLVDKNRKYELINDLLGLVSMIAIVILFIQKG